VSKDVFRQVQVICWSWASAIY